MEKLWTLVYQRTPCTQKVHVNGQPRLVSIIGASLPSKNSSRMPVSHGDGMSSTSLWRGLVSSIAACPSRIAEDARTAPRARRGACIDLPASRNVRDDVVREEVALAEHVDVDLGCSSR